MLGQVPVYRHYSGILSMRPRVSGALAFRENIVVRVAIG